MTLSQTEQALDKKSGLLITSLDDSAVTLHAVFGLELDADRAVFETMLASGLNSAALERSLAIPTAQAGHWCVSLAGGEEAPSAPVPPGAPVPPVAPVVADSVAIACGLIIGKYVPDDWTCGLLLENRDNLYLTCFTGRGLLGRERLPSVLSLHENPEGLASALESTLAARPLRTLRGSGSGAGGSAGLDALYLADERMVSGFQEVVEYPVEALPRDRGELIGRGLSYLGELSRAGVTPGSR